jgi:Rne/Rng family ribonuclease
MPKELVISAAPHETRVAILEDGQLCEIYIEREKEFALVGSIYKGRVTRVLPGMQSAFVDIGLDSDAFLYVGDFLENLEDYDHVVTAVEGKVEKMEQQGGVVFAPAVPGAPGAPGEPGDTAAPDLTAAPTQSLSEVPSGSDLHAAEGSEAQPASYESASQPQRAPFAGQPPFTGQHGAPPFRQERRPGPGYRPDQRGDQRGSDQRSDYRQGQGQGPREGQGHDRGGRQRGGRFRRGRGGDRRPGRDLPPSKYASPRPYVPSASRPYEPPTEEPAGDYTPVILPGESLAKYKDRMPGAPSAAQGGAAGAAGKSETPSGAPVPALPASLYAAPGRDVAEPAESVRDAAAAEPEALLASEHPVELESEAGLTEPDTRLHETQQTLAHETLPESFAVSHEGSGYASGEHDDAPELSGSPAVLSDDEAASLAEQVAEARQEEASANADAAAAAAARLVEPEETDDDATAQRFLHDDSAEHDIADSEAHEDEESGEGVNENSDELSASEEHQEHGDDAEGQGAGASETGESSLAADAESGESGADDRGNVAPAAPLPPRPMSARISDPQRARFQRPVRRGNRQRGNRPRHQDHRHQAARRPQLISEMLKAGQEIIVQIAKEPLGKKGARITSHVALPGRFLVYMPTVNHIGVSRRIGSAEERSRLRRSVTEAKGTFPGGFIVRTAAEGAPEDEIRSDVEFLGRTWDKIRTQAEPRKSPALLHRDLNLVERILRDYVSNDYTAIWIDNEEEFGKVVDFVSRFQPKLVSRVKLYTKPTPIFEEFGIQQELDKALHPKVWLKSGGYIVINHTEALVAIDVNTGKYVGRGSTRLEDTIVKTNLEAVKEIIRQIRLRDLGGIIVLDFIDMEERRNRDKVMAALDAALRADRAPSKALPFNEFGLVAVTRKRTKQALERVLCQPCPYCTGSGMVKSVPTICYEIQAEAKKMSADLDATSLTLRVHPEIAKALKTRESMLIEELEQATRKSVIIQADPTLHWEQYDIY